MKNDKLSFVFFGSGPVAAESLELLATTFTIEAVVTKPTTKHEMQSAAPGATIHSVSDKKELDDLFTTNDFESSIGILIDFGIIVSKKIINYFEYGIVNSHFSLLPELRGADPISFAILEGKTKTGVSLMLLVEAMDEGPIIATSELLLSGDETAPQLTQELIQLSNNLLSTSLEKYVNGEMRPTAQITIQEQSGITPSYTRKLTKADGLVDWEKPAETIEREIRAFLDWPKSYATLSNIDCVILQATVVKLSGRAGQLFIHDKKLAIYCGLDALTLDYIKPAGKKSMDSQAFLAGYKARLQLS